MSLIDGVGGPVGWAGALTQAHASEFGSERRGIYLPKDPPAGVVGGVGGRG